MSTLSVSELQAQVETDYSSATLQQIIDAVERDIEEFAGPTASFVHEYDGTELVEVLKLPVQASSVTSVVEFEDARSEPTKTTLETDDYELSNDGWFLRRLSSGTNPRSTWGWHAVVTFEPLDDTDRRKQAAVQLARLEIEHSAYSQEKIGDWGASRKELTRERNQILSRLDQSYVD